MEEDRGAFKTNPRNPAHFRHFVIPILPGNTLIGIDFNPRFPPVRRAVQPQLFGPTARRGLLYSGFSLIRGGEGG